MPSRSCFEIFADSEDEMPRATDPVWRRTASPETLRMRAENHRRPAQGAALLAKNAKRRDRLQQAFDRRAINENDFGAARLQLETEARGLAPKGTHADFRLRPLRGDASPSLIRKPGSIFAQIIARGAANASVRRNPALAPASSVHIKQESIAMPLNHSDPASENPAGPGEPVSAGTGKESRQTAAKSSLADEQRQHAEAMRHSRPSPAAPLPILRN
jgi:hypothetical protein